MSLPGGRSTQMPSADTAGMPISSSRPSSRYSRRARRSSISFSA